ncbi:MAG TPA: hypothetical protein VM076_24080 [Gemmatimonadaceae bacterium]|nr:hypothetical protein [Gemmatimonadaceae bacterium]
MNHLDDDRLDEYLDPAGSVDRAAVEAHLAECVSCSARLDAVRRVIERLAGVPREADTPRDLWTPIAKRLTVDRSDEERAPAREPNAPPRWRQRHRVAAGLAAAAAVFAAGVAVGSRAAMTPSSNGGAPLTTRPPIEVAADVQRAGTAYVTALARLSESGAPADIRMQGREAALAALYAASRQLVELTPDNRDALAILRAVSESHLRDFTEGASRGSATVKF